MTGPKSEARTPCAAVSMSAVLAVLAANRFDLATEKLTQAGIEDALAFAFEDGMVSREHRLGPGDIPDFLIGGGLVVEVKGPRHQATAVVRQLARYAAYPEVTAIVLATARAMTMPAQIGGKPCRVVNLGRAWL